MTPRDDDVTPAICKQSPLPTMKTVKRSLLSVAALAAMLGGPAVQAATFSVTSLADSGPGSLRQAVADANANAGTDVITFATSGTIVLTGGELSIADDLTVQGPGAGRLAIDGNGSSRVFAISGTGTDVTISGLTIRNGAVTGANGGGIYVSAGNTLALLGSTVSGNRASGNGGGIAAAGALRRPAVVASSSTLGRR